MTISADVFDLALIKAVFYRALEDFQMMCSLPHKRAVRSKEAGLESGNLGYVVRREIVYYFFSDDPEPHDLTFQGISDQLEIDMEYIRSRLLQYWKTVKILKKRRGRRHGRHGYLSRNRLPAFEEWCVIRSLQ